MGMKRSHDISMESTFGATTALCCSCGVPMVPNQSMRCAACLKAEVSITDGISRKVVLQRCRNCTRCSPFEFFLTRKHGSRTRAFYQDTAKLGSLEPVPDS
eukprot:s2074_g12.t1